MFIEIYKQNDEDLGTGLGLSICSLIAEKLGGYLDLHSPVGVGSRFSIQLPYDEKPNKMN
ncbi:MULTISPECIES: ATP-binding protein [Parabacteroides]|uniref:ATP-binding protein n=1 Tax=Parabacteroides provencensis TaxID=1944636 RepID=UPI000C15197F|nr:ATP-binding protein [Parabacteroides provencensis]